MTSGYPASRYSTLRRSPIGAKKRAIVRAEESWYPAWEHLLQLHRLDFWHCRVAQQSQPGFPDYEVYGLDWIAWVELKAVQATGRIGKLSVAQQRYKASIERGGGEYKVFVLPTDWSAVDEWLVSRTGIEIRGVAQSWRAGGGLVAG